MATGAVLFSLPLALALATYGYVALHMTVAQSLLIYMSVGTTTLLTATLFSGLRLSDFR